MNFFFQPAADIDVAKVRTVAKYDFHHSVATVQIRPTAVGHQKRKQTIKVQVTAENYQAPLPCQTLSLFGAECKFGIGFVV